MTFTIQDLQSFTAQKSLDDFGVNNLLSLDHSLFIALREFYRRNDCILDKEQYFLLMFNDAYFISKLAARAKRPYLQRADYADIASRKSPVIEMLPPGDLFKKDTVMAMVWCILSTYIKAHPDPDLRVLLDDIREFHINPQPEFCNIVAHNLYQVDHGKKAQQLSLYDELLQEKSDVSCEAQKPKAKKRYASSPKERLDQAIKKCMNDAAEFSKRQEEVRKMEKVKVEAIRTLVSEIIAYAEAFPSNRNERAEVVKEVLLAKQVHGVIPYGVLDEVLIERISNLGRKEGGVHIGTLNAQNLYDIHDNKEVKL